MTRRRWLLGLEPIFEGGWWHKGDRAHHWTVESRLIAVALLGDVTVDLAEAKSAPAEIAINAFAIFRDVDVTVTAGTRVELVGRGFRGHLTNEVPTGPETQPHHVVRIHGHALAGDVTVRLAAGHYAT